MDEKRQSSEAGLILESISLLMAFVTIVGLVLPSDYYNIHIHPLVFITVPICWFLSLVTSTVAVTLLSWKRSWPSRLALIVSVAAIPIGAIRF